MTASEVATGWHGICGTPSATLTASTTFGSVQALCMLSGSGRGRARYRAWGRWGDGQHRQLFAAATRPSHAPRIVRHETLTADKGRARRLFFFSRLCGLPDSVGPAATSRPVMPRHIRRTEQMPGPPCHPGTRRASIWVCRIWQRPRMPSRHDPCSSPLFLSLPPLSYGPCHDAWFRREHAMSRLGCRMGTPKLPRRLAYSAIRRPAPGRPTAAWISNRRSAAAAGAASVSDPGVHAGRTKTRRPLPYSGRSRGRGGGSCLSSLSRAASAVSSARPLCFLPRKKRGGGRGE